MDWPKALRSPHTLLLLLATGFAYFCFIRLLPARPIVWASGGTISSVTLLAWIRQFPRHDQDSELVNLLDQTVFLSQLTLQETPLSATAKPLWQRVQQQAQEIQSMSSQMAVQDALLIPDLLETLHTVLALTNQVRETLKALDQMQTSVYRNLANQNLQQSCARLRTTHEQIQHLYEHMVLSQASQNTDLAQLPEQLQLLIDTNKAALQPEHSRNLTKD